MVLSAQVDTSGARPDCEGITDMGEFIVTTLNDELDDGASIVTPGGDGLSLREAIGLANDAAGEDSIVFADGLEGVVRLNNAAGTLQINENISILGDDRITISGDSGGDDTVVEGVTDLSATAATELDDNQGIFFLSGGLTNVVLDGLTLTGGRGFSYGGAIDAFTSGLTVSGSTLAGNIVYGGYGGGAIYSNGYLRIEDSTFFGNVASDGDNADGHGGGAIFSRSGDLSAINTTFVGNQALQGDTPTAPSGGAIFAEGGVYLNNVTMTGNLAEFQGGGLFVDGADADVAITNSIILGNRANVLFGGIANEVAN